MPSQSVARRGGAARALARLLARSSALAIVLSVSPLGLVGGTEPGWLRIAAPAAQARENVSLPSLSIQSATGALVLKNVSVTGSSLGAAELKALFEGGEMATLADRLARFDADRMTIESLDWTVGAAGAPPMRSLYKGFEARDIRAGMIGSITVSGAEMEQAMNQGGKSGRATGRMGPMKIEKLDIAHMVRFFGSADPSRQAPMKDIHGPYSVEFYEMTMPEAQMRFGRMSSAGMRAKLLPVSMMDFLKLATEAEGKKDDAALQGRMLGVTMDLLQSFEFGETRMESANVSGKTPDGKSFEMKMGPIAFGGPSSRGSMDGLEFKADDGFIKIRRLGVEGDFMAAVAAMLRQVAPAEAGLADRPLPPMKSYAVTLEGLEADLPDDNKSRQGAPAPRIRFTLASFDSRTSNFVGANPTDVDMSLKSFALPIPADSPDSGLRELRAAGFERIDLSASVQGRWDEAGKAYRINDVTIDLGGMARATLKGELGNVARGVFDGPPEARMVAALAGNIRNATLTLTNLGGAEKLLAKVAKDQNKTPTQFGNEVALMGPAVIGMFLSDHPDAQALGSAVGTFLKTFGTITVRARSASPDGLTAADFVAAQNPIDVLRKVRFEANAQ